MYTYKPVDAIQCIKKVLCAKEKMYIFYSIDCNRRNQFENTLCFLNCSFRHRHVTVKFCNCILKVMKSVYMCDNLCRGHEFSLLFNLVQEVLVPVFILE